METSRPLVVSYGGGTNSTAMLIGFVNRQVVPDLILFADTKGEKSGTYQYVEMFSRWMHARGLPAVVWVSNDGMYDGLEDNCVRKSMLPSLAYGFKSCSDKYKIRPQDKHVRQWRPAQECWGQGLRVRKAIGYHAAEERRAKIQGDTKYTYEYPLIEWGWDGDDCRSAIEAEGLPLPGKSACFFCPASRKPEVFWLAKNEPGLFARAVAMESAARDAGNLRTVKGLGRHWTWKDLVEDGEQEARHKVEVLEMPCLCIDDDC